MDEFLILSIVGFAIQIAFIAIALLVLTNSSRATREEAKKAQAAATQAQSDAHRAQIQASAAAEKLARSNDIVITNLTNIEKTGEATHRIVNSQRTIMLRLIALQAKRIATDNPNDADAQRAYLQAASDALVADELDDESVNTSLREKEL